MTFSCPLCSRLFLVDPPFQGGFVPSHRDPLLGTQCGGSLAEVGAYLEIPDAPPAPAWPRFDPERIR